jgi:hypothetical protein
MAIPLIHEKASCAAAEKTEFLNERRYYEVVLVWIYIYFIIMAMLTANKMRQT